MHFCSGLKAAGAEVRCTKERKKEAEQAISTKKQCTEAKEEGQKLFITDFTVLSLKPTWKGQVEHSKSPRFLTVPATTAVFQ